MSFDDLATLGVVVAHPDDESFGLGAVLAALAAAGAGVRVVCFTQGEASTLGPSVGLDLVRRDELHAAADVLGLSRMRLASYRDGGLGDVSPALLDREIEADIAGASLVVVFEPSGVTGHVDHRAATAAAERVAAQHGLPVLEWGVTPHVAAALNVEMGTCFVPLDGVDVAVDRSAQLAAIACHESQARDNPVLIRRLQLQGALERVRFREPAALKAEPRVDTPLGILGWLAWSFPKTRSLI
ncbi:MAG: PIG-L family deacetylase [Acidimicrobiia bacterium]|nr:PIG-L family deacetylase [Acidimicrobiia bacterium]